MREIRRHGKLHTHAAFSLVELVVVITIIGTLTAIALPRLTNASKNANRNAVKQSVNSVRKAVDVYYAEHLRYPGYNDVSGAPDNDAFVDQLVKYTDINGKTSDAYSSVFMYGPYLRAPFPKNPTNGLDTVHVKAAPGDADPADGSVGWIAVLSHGYFGISASDTDLDRIGLDTPLDKGLARLGL